MKILLMAIVRFKLEFALFFLYFISYIVILNLVDNTIVSIKKVEIEEDLEVDTDKSILEHHNNKLVKLHTASNVLRLTSVGIAAIFIGYGILSIAKDNMSSVLGFGALCLSVFFVMFAKLNADIQNSIVSFIKHRKNTPLNINSSGLKKLK